MVWRKQARGSLLRPSVREAQASHSDLCHSADRPAGQAVEAEREASDPTVAQNATSDEVRQPPTRGLPVGCRSMRHRAIHAGNK